MNTIFKAIVGSQSYGTSTPTSDIDYKGVYMQPINELISFGYKEQIEVGKDETYYEVRRFLQLLQSANPTVLELLYSPQDCILETSPAFDLIVKHRDKFLTKKCLMSFGGYAIAQIKKAKGLDKKMNWEKGRVVRKGVLDFCYVLNEDFFGTLSLNDWLKREDKKQEHCGLSKLTHFKDCYSLFYDHLSEMKSSNPKFEGSGHSYNGVVSENANDVRLSDIPKFAIRDTILYFNKDGYSMHCKDYREYELWLENRNTQRYVDIKGHNQKIDGKNMLHCRRLLDMAMEIATDKTITVKRPNAEYLLKIRKGEVNLDEIIEQAEKDIEGLDLLFEKSGLPNEVDFNFVNDLLIQIRFASLPSAQSLIELDKVFDEEADIKGTYKGTTMSKSKFLSLIPKLLGGREEVSNGECECYFPMFYTNDNGEKICPKCGKTVSQEKINKHAGIR